MLEKLVLGTAQFGLDYGINNIHGKPSDKEIEKILLEAYENNIFFLDTAEAYGDSQKRIGQFHMKHPDKKFNIITKFYEPLFSGDFREHILNNLAELNTDSLYTYMFHNKTDIDKYKGEISKLYELKEDGFIQKIGVSLYTNDEVIDVLNRYDFIDLIQIPFNLLDNINQRREALSLLKEKGIEVHTRSAFLQGLFFMKEMPFKLVSLKQYIDEINKVSQKYAKTVSAIALNYCLIQQNIDKVLVGIETEEQLKDNISAVKALDSNIVKEIDQIKVLKTELLNPANW